MDADAVVRVIISVLGLLGVGELIRGFIARRRTTAETQKFIAESDNQHAAAASAVAAAARELLEPLTEQLGQQRRAMTGWTDAVRVQMTVHSAWDELAVSSFRPLPPPPPLDLPDFEQFMREARR